MQQKTTWTHFLTLGLIISLLLALSSCKDYFYSIVGEYHFVNETNHTIVFPIGYEKFNVSPKSTVKIIEQGKGAGNKGTVNVIGESDFGSPLFSLGTTNQLIIKFDQAKCLIDVKVED